MFKLLLALSIIQITDSTFTNGESTVYEIHWSNAPKQLREGVLEKFEVMSSLGEKYTCVLSQEDQLNITENPIYKGPLALDFIEHLFSKGICSYRLDPYWTYEVCHGRHIRQYHEILDGSRLKLQQYTLGKMGTKEREMVLRKMKEDERSRNSTFKIPTKRVENKELPYVKICMTDGSVCDHNRRKLRRSNVYYMCDMKAHHDIHTVKEVTSCVYEIIILTPVLCAHRKYRPKRIPTSPITCYATGKSPKVPYSLAKIYSDRRSIITKAANGEGRIEFVSYDKKSDNSISVDSDLVDDFLAGKNCISGGTGVWKYEFCYGKYINQYTYGMLGLRTTVCLGKFVLSNHVDWIRNRPYKRPKPVGHRSYITQFYSDGCISNITGRPRQTEVKLKCMENSANRNSLVMYLYETNYGEYLLGIESPILCHVVPLADEDGLIYHKI